MVTSQFSTLLKPSRKVLIDALAKLADGDLDRKANKGAKTIGESLLHIAAFEFVSATAKSITKGGKVKSTLWEKVAPGFAREAGFMPPTGLTLGAYASILKAVRAYSATVFTKWPNVAKAPLTDHEIEITGSALKQSASKMGFAGSYDDLIREMKGSKMVHGGNASVSAMLLSHESYHRGQIFFHRHALMSGA